jgi:hypothetical protein
VPDRLETFHRPLASPGRLMRILGAVQVLRPAMLHRRHALAVRHLVAGERVGDHHPGHLPQALEQSAEQLLCGHRVSARLDQNIEHVAVLVDRAPQIPLCAVDLDEHLIEVPVVAPPPTTTAQLVRLLLPEPVAPGDPTKCAASVVVMPVVARVAVTPVVVVAAPPLPVVAPPRIPILAGTPVIFRERHRLGLGDGCRPQTGEPQTCGRYECCCCNTCDSVHTRFCNMRPRPSPGCQRRVFLPRRPAFAGLGCGDATRRPYTEGRAPS